MPHDLTRTPTPASWRKQLWQHARVHGWATAGLGLALLGMLYLIGHSVVQLLGGHSTQAMRWAFQAGMVAFGATALGAVPAFFIRKVPQKLEDSMLGMAAGMMLAATAFSLLLPALQSAGTVLQSKPWGAGLVVFGMGLGVLLMLGMDVFVPHEHANAGKFGPDAARYDRMWLFVFAIAVHNLPEGMAIGAGFAQTDLSVGVPITLAIALQDIPEGLAVAIALQSMGYSPLRSVLVGAATGLLEPLGALMGVALSSGMPLAYPLGLGIAAGAMLFVVSHEVIPETHRNGHQTAATLGLMAGFALMMVLDTVL